MPILEELGRRRVIQTAALYIAVAWAGTEILAFLIDALFGGAAAVAARRYLAILLIAGFPAAMYLAWTRDLGLKARRIISAGAVAVFVVAVLLITVPPPPPPDTLLPITENSIAVLPFQVCEDRTSDRTLAGGVTGAVFNRLAQRNRLKVSGRRSVETVSESAQSIASMAGLLGVEYLLSGVLCRDGLDLTLHAELMDHKGFIVWENDFKQGVNSFDQVEDRLAALVDNNVAAELGDTVHASTDTAVDRKAHEQLLIAQEYSRQDQREQAITAYKKALELQPGYLEARYELAWLEADDDNVDNDAAGLEQVQAIVEEALPLARAELQSDPQSFEANRMVGRMLFALGSLKGELAYREFHEKGEDEVVATQADAQTLYAEAERQFRSALAINPSATDVRVRLARSLDEQGIQRRKESLEILLQGRDRDPFNDELNTFAAYRLDEFGRLREAMEILDRFEDLPQGKSESQHWPQFEILQNQGRTDEELAYLIEALEKDLNEAVLTYLWRIPAGIARFGLVEEAKDLYAKVARIPNPEDTADWIRWRQFSLVDPYLWATGRLDEIVERKMKKIADLSKEEILEAWNVEASTNAWTFWFAGERERAIELFEAMQHYPFEPTRWAQAQMMYPMELAFMYMQVGREDDAAALLEKAVTHLRSDVDAGARHPSTLMLLAEAYGWQGNDEAALEMLDLAINYGGYDIELCCEEFWPYSREDLHMAKYWWDMLEDNPKFILSRSRMKALVEQKRSNIRALLAQHDMDRLLAPLMASVSLRLAAD